MTEQINLDVVKNYMRSYVNSGAYHQDIETVISQAASHISSFIGKPNVCVILDVDQTSIDQMPLMNKYDFGWFEFNLEIANIETNFPVIQEMLDFYNNLLANYVDVIFCMRNIIFCFLKSHFIANNNN